MSSNLSDAYLIWEQMLEATKNGDVATFMRLVDAHRLPSEDLDRVTTTSLLAEACKLKSPVIGLKLLELGANAMSNKDLDLRPLHSACAWSTGTALVQALIQAGANVNDVDSSGWAPIHQAALADDAQCVHFLLDHGANVMARDDEKWTPLHTAMHTGCLEAARALISRGAPLNLTDDTGMTPAGRALRSNNFDEALWLVALGLKPSKEDLRQDPNNRYLKLAPPVAAAKGGHADVLISMIEDGRIDPLDASLMKRLRTHAARAKKHEAVATLDAARAQASILAVRRLSKSPGATAA